MIEYLGLGKNPSISGAGLVSTAPEAIGHPAGAALTIIIWDAVVTFVLLKGIGLFVKLRIPDEQLEIGDVAVHGEEALPVRGIWSAIHTRWPTRPPDVA